MWTADSYDDAPPVDGGCRVVLIINIYYLYLNFIIMVSLKSFWNLPSISISLLLAYKLTKVCFLR